MGWERRGPSGPYYTRSRRVGDRVVREYVGGGQLGAFAAGYDEEQRRTRAAAVAALRAEEAEWAEADGQMEELESATNLLMRAALIVAGYHQHARGAWRKRRNDRD